jgi:hypothetical protein
MPTTGRQVFRNLGRQLTDAELASPGVQKLLLDDYEHAEQRAAEMESYVNRFHDADKRAAILEEKLRADRSNEVMSTVGVALGGAILGLAPWVFDLFKPKTAPGIIAMGLGIVMMAGAALGRMMRR